VLGETAVSWLDCLRSCKQLGKETRVAEWAHTDCSRGLGTVSLGAAWPALMRAAVLSFFLFALPLSV
jgi:hypothetical protein